MWRNSAPRAWRLVGMRAQGGAVVPELGELAGDVRDDGGPLRVCGRIVG
jgi:hypothetical protein